MDRRIIFIVHAEIPADISIMEIHNIIDDAEEISEDLNIHLVIHMDQLVL